MRISFLLSSYNMLHTMALLWESQKVVATRSHGTSSSSGVFFHLCYPNYSFTTSPAASALTCLSHLLRHLPMCRAHNPKVKWRSENSLRGQSAQAVRCNFCPARNTRSSKKEGAVRQRHDPFSGPTSR